MKPPLRPYCQPMFAATCQTGFASSAGTGSTQLMASVALAAIISQQPAKHGFPASAQAILCRFCPAMIMMFDPIKRKTGVMQSLQRG